MIPFSLVHVGAFCFASSTKLPAERYHGDPHLVSAVSVTCQGRRDSKMVLALGSDTICIMGYGESRLRKPSQDHVQ